MFTFNAKTNVEAAKMAVAQMRFKNAVMPSLNSVEATGQKMVFEIHAAALMGMGELLDRGINRDDLGVWLIEAMTDIACTFGLMASSGDPKIGAEVAEVLFGLTRERVRKRGI